MTKAILFPGQGSQSVGMGRDLYDSFSCAKDVFDEVDEALHFKLSSLIFEGNEEELTLTQNAQPALMTVSMAVCRVLQELSARSLKDIFSYTAGHSLGQWTALCAADSLTLSETAVMLRKRGAAMGKASCGKDGSMASIIGLSVAEVQKIVEESAGDDILVIANDNSIGQTVVSGETKAVERAMEKAKQMKAKMAVKLSVSGAFHSPLMRPAAQDLEEEILALDVKTPQITVIDNVTADVVTDAEQIKQNLVRQIYSPVRWTESVQKMASLGVTQTTEAGAGKVLSGLVRRIDDSLERVNLLTKESIEEFVKSLL